MDDFATFADELIRDFYISRGKMYAFSVNEYVITDEALRELIAEAINRAGLNHEIANTPDSKRSVPPNADRLLLEADQEVRHIPRDQMSKHERLIHDLAVALAILTARQN